MIKSLACFLLSILLFTSCNTSNKKKLSNSESDLNVDNIAGNYVTKDYFKRSEGYDWISVTISKITDLEARVNIRSRIDRKKPTCTFNGIGLLIGSDSLTTEYENVDILIYLQHDTLFIKSADDKDSSLLYYFCSGGATLADSYVKLNEPLDYTQLLNFDYTKKLSLQGITFIVKSTNEGSLNTLLVEIEGLEEINQKVLHEIDGSVVDAEIEDLNIDGWPEILVYVTSAGSGSYGSVIGYSVNNGKSMSQIYFPDTGKNKKINKGYMGHDEFSIVETNLMQRFPIYEFGDANAKPSGRIRQVEYKLIDGEAARIFKVENIYEF